MLYPSYFTYFTQKVSHLLKKKKLYNIFKFNKTILLSWNGITIKINTYYLLYLDLEINMEKNIIEVCNFINGTFSLERREY